MQQIFGIVGTLVAGGALLAALASYVALHRQGRRTRARMRGRGVLDAWLLGLWAALLAGSVGLLVDADWAGTALRVGLGLLVAWTLWYSFANLYVLRSLEPDVPVRWRPVVVGNLVVWALVAAVVTGVLLGLRHAGL